MYTFSTAAADCGMVKGFRARDERQKCCTYYNGRSEKDGRERGEEEMSFIKKFGERGGTPGAKLVTAMAKVG
jgi:hypothetical protein